MDRELLSPQVAVVAVAMMRHARSWGPARSGGPAMRAGRGLLTDMCGAWSAMGVEGQHQTPLWAGWPGAGTHSVVDRVSCEQVEEGLLPGKGTMASL